MLGSWVLAHTLGGSATNGGVDVEVGRIRAVLGGTIMLFGSRLAGGCTSGHGISGMSLLSVSSFVSVAAMFAGGWDLRLSLARCFTTLAAWSSHMRTWLCGGGAVR